MTIANLDDIEVLKVLDWRKLDEKLPSPTVQRFIDAHIEEPFDLNTGPLFKAKLLQLMGQKYVLLINMHHIISDGWSMGVFVRELRQAYTAFAQDQTPNLSPLPNSLFCDPQSYAALPYNTIEVLFGKWSGVSNFQYLFEKQLHNPQTRNEYEKMRSVIKSLAIEQERYFTAKEVLELWQNGVFK